MPKLYAHLTDGVEPPTFDYIGALPKKYKNISGLDVADESFLLSNNWLPVTEIEVVLGPNQTADTDDIQIDLIEKRVTLTHRARDRSVEEINHRKAQQMEVFRENRDERLASSDRTQLPDFPLSDEKRAEWRVYRQVLRDLPATADMTTWRDNFTWPTEPS